MCVGDDDGGAGFVEALEVGNDAAEGFEGLVCFQVADMLEFYRKEKVLI